MASSNQPTTGPLRVSDLAAPNIFRLSRRGDAAWCKSQLTITKLCIRIHCPASSCTRTTHYFRQMSMPKPVCPNMAAATPLGSPGPDGAEAARRAARGGRATICRQNPSSRGRGAEDLCLGAAILHSGHLRGIGPRTGPWKDPDPRRRSSRGSEDSEWAGLPGMAATRRLRAVPSQRLPGAMISGAPAVL